MRFRFLSALAIFSQTPRNFLGGGEDSGSNTERSLTMRPRQHAAPAPIFLCEVARRVWLCLTLRIIISREYHTFLGRPIGPCRSCRHSGKCVHRQERTPAEAWCDR